MINNIENNIVQKGDVEKKLFSKLQIFHLKLIFRANRTILLIFIFAVCCRSILPLYFLLAKLDPFAFMFTLDGLNIFNWATSFAAGNPIDKMDGPYIFATIVLGMAAKILLPIKNISLTVTLLQIMQGVVDSFGCLLIYGILGLRFSENVKLIGALLYAVWLPSIYLCFNFFAVTYTPIIILAIGFSISHAIKYEKWIWFILAGLFFGISFIQRPDNLFIMPLFIFYALWLKRKRLRYVAGKMVLVLVVFIAVNSVGKAIYFDVFNVSKRTEVSFASVALYNSTSEYPGNFNWLRFGHDTPSTMHAQEKARQYMREKDRVFMFLYTIYNGDPFLLAYIREVIIGKPILYVDSLIRRFIAYLPAQPYYAYTIWRLSMIDITKSAQSIVSDLRHYRYDQIYNGFKYFDYLLFILFCLGTWRCRKNSVMLSLVTIYLGVLIGHVLTQFGEYYYRLDREVSDQ